MSLITPRDDATDPEFRRFVDGYRQEFKSVGPLLNSIRTMQYRPRILQSALELHRAAMETYPDSRVTPELKLLLATVTSGAAGCRYCQAHTSFLAQRRGCDSDRLDAVWEFQTSSLFSDAERAALALAQGAGVTPNAVTPEMREQARKYWTDEELVEIVAIIAAMGFANRWNDTVATPLEDPAKDYATEHLTPHGWELGRH